MAEHKSGNALMQKISQESNGKVGVCTVIDPGQSVTLTPYLFHRFWGEEGKGTVTVIVREVSMCNDDANDNCFYDKAGRFPEIIEDEAPLHLLCNEYNM